MLRIFGLLFSIIVLSINILADIPPPPVGEKIRIEVKQDYSDYQFYIASYDMKVVPNPNPPHPSRPNMVVPIPESFKLKKIDLSIEKPFIESITTKRIQYRGSLVGNKLWLVAVKKTIQSEIEPKIKTAIDTQKNADGIYIANLSQQLNSEKDFSQGAKIIIHTVKLDESGLQIEASEGTASAKSEEVTVSIGNNAINIGSKKSVYIGIGLFLTGMTFLGGWAAKKRFN